MAAVSAALKPLRWPRLWLGLWIAAVVALVVVCLVPLDSLPPLPENSDKVEHLLGYFLLASAAVQLFGSRRSLSLAAMGLIALGIGIEFAQGFTAYRSSDPADAVASQVKMKDEAQQSGVSVQSTLILGGQIAGERPGLYMIYPLGNCIATSPETPYLQIGESKYGKPILDRILRPQTTLEDAARCALVSLDSTIRSNLSVGLPIDIALIRAGDLKITQKMRMEGDTPLYSEIHETWSRKLEAAVHSLPRFPWEPARAPEEQASPLPALPPRRVAPRPDPGDASGQQQ